MKFGVKLEDKQTSVNIGITLSTQLISASLSMIALVGVLFVFILDKKEVGYIFYIFISLSFFSFILSIILGGKGINIVRKEGFDGNWSLSCSKKKFNYQAVFCLLGIIFCIISIFKTNDKPNNLLIELRETKNLIKEGIDSERSLQIKYDTLKKEIEEIKVEIRQFENSRTTNNPKYNETIKNDS